MQLTPEQKNILQKTSLFISLTDASFQKITNQSVVVSLNVGEKLFEQGDPVNNFFFF
jgi:CRP-like cAMP-binding protein